MDTKDVYYTLIYRFVNYLLALEVFSDVKCVKSRGEQSGDEMKVIINRITSLDLLSLMDMHFL